MFYAPQGVQAVGTITLGASGEANAIASIYPIRSSVPFVDLTISIVPVEDNVTYTASVYHLGELLETHTYPTNDLTLCYMSYPNMIFPANIGTNAIPRFYDPDRLNAEGISIRVELTNLGSEQRSFLVYATYIVLEGARFDKITQDT